MPEYKIKFKLCSFYDDEKYNLEKVVSYEIDAKDLDELEEIVDDTDYVDNIDDSPVINKETDGYPNNINIDYIEIRDGDGENHI